MAPARHFIPIDEIFTEAPRENLSGSQLRLKIGYKWIVKLRTIRKRHLPAEKAADLVATDRWRWGASTLALTPRNQASKTSNPAMANPTTRRDQSPRSKPNNRPLVTRTLTEPSNILVD
jgi:hypothetical protein